MIGRVFSREVYADLKTTFRALRRRIGKQDAAASLTRVSQQHISRYEALGEDDAEYFPPIDVIADLERECGEPIVTRRLAELSRHVLVCLPQVGDRHAPLGRVSAEALKEVGDVFSTLGEQLSDGIFTSVEDRLLGREIDEAIVKLLQLKAQAHAVVQAREGRG
jgi:hypothetical protein